MNETYRKAKEALDLAKRQECSTCACFIRPANQGKTQTAQILAVDEKAMIIPAMSVSEQSNWFAERIETPYFILDDPSDWFNVLDRQHVLSILKNALAGYFKASRATKFDINIPLPITKKVCVLLFMTNTQYSMIRRDMELVGLSARAELYLTKHAPEEFERIKREYIDHKYSSFNLPKFHLNGNTTFDDAFLSSGIARKYYPEEIELEERPKKVNKK